MTEYPTSYVSVDTETTGLYAKYGDKIIQLSAVRYENDTQMDSFNVFINPEGTVNQAEFKNHISFDNLKNAPSFSSVINSFRNFVGDLPWVGHNIGFDMNFMSVEGLDISNYKENKFDILGMARRTFGPSGNKLWQLEKRFDVTNEHQHNSLDDAIATAKIYQKLRDLVPPAHKSKHHSKYRKHVIADAKDNVLNGARIVFTGHFDNAPREELRNSVEIHGGKSPNTVSKLTDYLVLGTQTSKTKVPNHSEKELKAIEHGIPIITIDDFLSMLGGE